MQSLNDSLRIGVKLAILFASFMNIYKLAWVCLAVLNAFWQDGKHQPLLLDVAASTLCYVPF
jgi:hypothetical protein